jgi:hypothetical protein
MNSDAILKLLKEKYAEKNGWLFLPELRMSTGYSNEQRIDAWAIQAWRMSVRADGSRLDLNNRRISFEIKVSRGDAVKELRDPDKRWYAYSISHEFYFVAPAGLISVKELSKDDGLIEVDDHGLLTIVKAARVREGMPPKWSFVASLCRRIIEKENCLLENNDGPLP